METPKIIVDLEMMWVYFRGLLRGIMRYSDVNGPWSFYSTPGTREKMLPHLDSWNADGIILQYSTYSRYKKHIPSDVPIICVSGKEDGDCACIKPESKRAGELGAEYLLGLGFKEFAFCSFHDQLWSKERAEGFSERLSKDNYKTHLYKCSYSRYQRHWLAESEKLSQWLQSLPKPLALMTCNDVLGREIIEVCKKLNLRIPYEVAVLGTDNDEVICDLSSPPLSSILYYTESAGYEAAELMDKMMKGQDVGTGRVIVPVREIIERQSTNILFIKDPLVANAVQYIRRSTHENVKVEDVASYSSVSRRTLERRFREALGISVLEELKRSRIEMIVYLLLKTDKSISNIAKTIGLRSSKNLSRYFKEETGLNPQEYRRKYRFQSDI